MDLLEKFSHMALIVSGILSAMVFLSQSSWYTAIWALLAAGMGVNSYLYAKRYYNLKEERDNGK